MQEKLENAYFCHIYFPKALCATGVAFLNFVLQKYSDFLILTFPSWKLDTPNVTNTQPVVYLYILSKYVCMSTLSVKMQICKNFANFFLRVDGYFWITTYSTTI